MFYVSFHVLIIACILFCMDNIAVLFFSPSLPPSLSFPCLSLSPSLPPLSLSLPPLSLSLPPLSLSPSPPQMVSSSECILYHEGVSLNEELLKHTEFFPPHYSLTINDCPMATLPTEPVLVTVSNCVSPAEFTVRIIIIIIILVILLYMVYCWYTHTHTWVAEVLDCLKLQFIIRSIAQSIPFHFVSILMLTIILFIMSIEMSITITFGHC